MSEYIGDYIPEEIENFTEFNSLPEDYKAYKLNINKAIGCVPNNCKKTQEVKIIRLDEARIAYLEIKYALFGKEITKRFIVNSEECKIVKQFNSKVKMMLSIEYD